jgi:hypothetical protein
MGSVILFQDRDRLLPDQSGGCLDVTLHDYLQINREAFEAKDHPSTRAERAVFVDIEFHHAPPL